MAPARGGRPLHRQTVILESGSGGFERSEELEKAVDEWNDQNLARLLFTLARTIGSKQRKAGWTDEELRANAGLVEEAVPAENIPF